MHSVILVYPTRLLISAAALLLAGTACAGGVSVDTGQDQAALQGIGAAPDEASNPPGSPPALKSCESNRDCADACPPGSKGCACTTTPRGQKLCAPTCSADADCRVPPGAPPGTCDEGVCTPPPPRPKTCQSTADCSDACPPGSQGCTCAPTPHGEKVCAPTCRADADCPSIAGVPPLHCREGVCAPPPPEDRP